MKDRHVRMELAQERSAKESLGGAGVTPGPTGAIRAVGWDLAVRAAALGLAQGSVIDLAYRVRENEHPEYGGIEVEIVGIEPAAC